MDKGKEEEENKKRKFEFFEYYYYYYFSVHLIVIVVNKLVKFIVNIDKHFYELMINIVFLINQLHVLIVMDLVSFISSKF